MDLVPRPLVGHLPDGPLRGERPALQLLAPRHRPRRPQRDRHVQELLPELAAERPELPGPGDRRQPDEGPAGAAARFTVANAKGIYLDLLRYFGAHPEKLFVAVVAPPVTSPDTPGGRALADWLVDHWLQDSGYTAGNVLVFDFYNVLTSKTGGGASDVGLATGNHHRVWNGAVQHKTDDGADRLAYPSAGGDSHPNAAGDQKATAEFVPLLNAAYNAWKGNGGARHGRAEDLRAAQRRACEGPAGDAVLPRDRQRRPRAPR